MYWKVMTDLNEKRKLMVNIIENLMKLFSWMDGNKLNSYIDEATISTKR